MIDGDLRSAVHGKDAVLLAGLKLDAAQLDYLTHRGWAWMAPAGVWWSEGEERDSLWCTDEDGWSMSVAGLVLASRETFDIVACQHEWSTKPARDVLHIWEDWVDEAIKAGKLDGKHRNAPRKAIEAKEAWCRGEIDDAALKLARGAATQAARSAGWEASAAAWAAPSAEAWAAWAASDAASDAAWAAAWAASAAVREARDAAFAARSAAYETYCEEFTAHALTCIKDKKHIVAK